MKKIVIGCDNAAVELKNILIGVLSAKGIEVEDMGCMTAEDGTYYPEIAARVCRSVQQDLNGKRGILVCGTGLGMCITANKFKGIRAAVCHDTYSAERSILSNNCNVLCMGARVIGPELAKTILNTWLPLEFKDGSSTPKVENILSIERENLK